MHAIATMAERLRASPGDYGLVLANGGFLSKEAVGVYSTEPVSGWHPRVDDSAQTEIDEAAAPVRLAETAEAGIDSSKVTWKRRTTSRGHVPPANERGGLRSRVGPR